MEQLKKNCIAFDPWDTWWINKKNPRHLFDPNVKYILEVDDYEIDKRLNEEVNFRDFYFLFEDYSQLHISIQYDKKHPRKTAIAKQSYIPLKFSLGILNYYSVEYGSKILDCSREMLGKKISLEKGPFVPRVLEAIQGTDLNTLLPPINNRTFGITVFKYNAGEIMDPETFKNIKGGDILVIRSGLFMKHEKSILLKGKTKLGKEADLNSGIPYSSIISDFDIEKGKLRVIEEYHDKIIQNSYSLDQLKRGQLRIFRVVDRECIGW
ncbi:hypothetical protein TBLA_0B06550 [Henningerozyma blattae CBS 6284]|uniref:BBC1/AIM3 cysteine proteinase-fold domain-containing protein n=1 Tax=Henningerozyma blattae (strain ATCC 34711 / CBS 6284 / DSM 70876 / NBRC 10599 / NRRL Y-10934 / UCD 77-7) TaxID=1071380 RepID=I2GZC6_HENB6|nr:hypothetical protein TBLA_0B06550 [Tetrapisispora blattae CBS 6284]CCH59478.1 hypothetical protein TBLA_0B06550 [Tetrapisispora blattae CBS 6284]